MRKVLQLYRQHRASQPATATKHRNELLVDAESFAYIFASPNGEHQQDPLAKVKTAMLLIQKDSEARGYAPFIMRPSPLFTHGVFPARQRRCRCSQPHLYRCCHPAG